MNSRPPLVLGFIAWALAIEAAWGIAPAGSLNVASAETKFVHPSDPTCGAKSPCFNSIQAAVTAAVAGDVVRLQAGNYAEKFVIGDKNNTPGAVEADRIVIEGDPMAGPGGVVIQGTGTLCQQKFAVRIRDSKFVTLRGLTIADAPGKAVFLSGGSHANENVVVDRNRIYANRCGPTVQIGDGNSKVILSNNLIYNSKKEGVDVRAGTVTDHYLVGNTISRSRKSGVAMSGGAKVTLINNAITQNNSDAVGGDRGVRRRGSELLDPTMVRLRNNFICGNTNGELAGAILDATDAGNRTPTGAEGTGVTASAGCEVAATLFDDVDGVNDTAGDADDDFEPAAGSPLIDGGANPNSILSGYKSTLNRDVDRKARPRDGDGDSSKKYDVGAYEMPTAMASGPTTLTTETQASGGSCGTITMNVGGEGVPKRRDPADALTDPNAVCTAAGAPKACCENVGVGHCDEGTTVLCGSLTFGGGGPNVGSSGAESANAGGARTRYSLSCTSTTDTACAISGNAGDIPNGINCSSTGCGGVTPIESTSPAKVCALNTLAAPGATGTLNLQTGEISLATTTSASVNINTTTSFLNTACPRCRASQALGACSVTPLSCGVDADCPVGETCSVNSPEVFAAGGVPGLGVCDDDAANAGDPCYVFEPAGTTAGLTTDCLPTTGATAVIEIATTQTTAGASVSDAAGHFCALQSGNSECTFGNATCTAASTPAACCTGAGMGTCVGEPQVCCSGAGMGSCNNFNGCFGSANAIGNKAAYADIPGICTGISVTGTAAGPLTVGMESGTTTYGAISCIPAVNAGAVLAGLVNNNAGLPGPVVTSSKVTFLVE